MEVTRVGKHLCRHAAVGITEVHFVTNPDAKEWIGKGPRKQSSTVFFCQTNCRVFSFFLVFLRVLLLRCQLARWCSDWMTTIGRRVRCSVVIGGMVHGMTPSRFARERVWLCGRALVAQFPDVHGLDLHQMLFGLAG